MSDSEDSVVCPLCQTRVQAAGGGDALQLHYLTNCSGYDKVSSGSSQPKATAKTGYSSSARSYLNTTTSSSEGVSSTSAAATGGALQYSAGPTTPSAAASVSSTVGESAGASSSGGPSEDETTSSVQFMWQPLSDINYPTITLLASFKGGSVDLKIDPDGGHYASQFTSIPKGTYEGQLVIGDSFMHPVKKFTIEKDNDIVVLQFEVHSPGGQTSGDLDGSSYGGHYGSGYMQKNPSYNQASTHSSYSYHNPAFGHGTPSTQGNYPEDRTSSGYHGEGYHYSAYGQPTLESASGSSYGRDRNVMPATHSSSSTKNRSAESELNGAANTPNSKAIIHDINIPMGSDAQSSGREGVSKPKEKESGFNVRQLQQQMSGGEGDQQLRDQLENLKQEKNDLLQNQERVNAQWEGRVRRLERQLQAYQKGEKPAESDTEASLRDARSTISELEREIATLRRQKSEGSQATKESRDLRKQLDEMKDRNTALEQQMMEYSTTVEDQAKLIQSLKGGGGSTQLHQMHKQQVEYSEAIESLRKKMEYTDKIAQENKETQQINIKLAGELEDYRSQTKRLIHDIQQKDQEIVTLRRALDQIPSSTSEVASLELATMKQKLSAWQEEVEKLAPLQGQVDTLQGELAQIQDINGQLHQQMQQLEGDIEKSQYELAKKASDYNTLNERFAELQQTRVNLENELLPLREERASILRENAHLLEGSDPKKYANLKKEHEALQAHCLELTQELDEKSSLLSAHQESNAEMQQQLDKATDPERLQSIRSRMERYKQERDAAKSRIEEVEKQLAIYQSEQETLTQQLQEATLQSETRLIELQLQMTQQEKNLGKNTDYEMRMRRYREERNKAMSDNRALRNQLITLEGTISDLLAQTGHQDTSGYLQTLTGDFESMDVGAGIEQSLEHDPGHQDFPPASPLEDCQPHLYSADEDHGESDHHQTPLEQEPQYQYGAVGGDGEDGQSSESRGSLERPKAKTVEVRVKEGVVHMNIQKPQAPLNTKNKPTVIVKRGNEYEAGTLMYTGTLGGKEVAGVQMSIRQPRPSGSNSSPSLAAYSDGTYKDGKRYFKCAVGFGLYVPVSKVFVESDII